MVSDCNEQIVRHGLKLSNLQVSMMMKMLAIAVVLPAVVSSSNN